MTFSEFDKIILLDKEYTENQNNGQKITGSNFRIINGNIPVSAEIAGGFAHVVELAVDMCDQRDQRL